MPTRKIRDVDKPWDKKEKVCLDLEHKPPTMQVFEPGVYEHTCPACGHVTTFTVAGVYHARRSIWPFRKKGK